MGDLKKWVDQDWVRIGTDGNIKGKCGTSKDKKTQTDVYLEVKHNRLVKVKERLQPKKRNAQEQKEKR